MNAIKLWLKGALHSLTVWFNGVLGTLLLSLPLLKDSLPELAAFLTPEVYKYLMITLVVVNILLRAKTSMSLTQKGQIVEEKKLAAQETKE